MPVAKYTNSPLFIKTRRKMWYKKKTCASEKEDRLYNRHRVQSKTVVSDKTRFSVVTNQYLSQFHLSFLLLHCPQPTTLSCRFICMH